MLQTMKTDIYFPNLGLAFRQLGNGITVFGFDIMYYGMIIVCGMLFGVLLACWRAKRAGEQPDMIIDFALYAIVAAVVGARLYYVAFAWDSFRDNPLSIFNLRTGGLAIYGGVIGGTLMAAVYAKLKKISFFRLTDICAPALLLGQVIGRWGNFFNREAFGTYTDGLFAMQIDRKAAGSDFSCSIAALEQQIAALAEQWDILTGEMVD
ncbi:MAG: prolipoprotein diacylglyceryl transferase, partial [Lachnospiraceae bacterium]|nr:prolipoprotein diacylglyceryl transferase [Lachnospiraceae bacterium]